jgi:VCBS repeat-containing protein
MASNTTYCVAGNAYDYLGSYRTITNVALYQDGVLAGNATVVNPDSYASWTFGLTPGVLGTQIVLKAIAYSRYGSATASVSVVFSSTNTMPVASPVSATVVQGQSVTVYPSVQDPDLGQSMRMIVVSPPVLGTFAATSSSYVVYAAPTNASGLDFFTYKVSDGYDDSNIATCTVTVLDNTVPTASNQTVKVYRNKATSSFNLSYTDPDSQTRTFTILSAPTNGTVNQLYGASNPSVVYTPNTNSVGIDSFTWKVSDGVEESGVATCTLVVGEWNTVAVVVNTNLHPLIEPQFSRYTNDLAADGYVPIVKDWNLSAAGQSTPSNLRDYLKTVSDLGGAVFIGDLPVANFHNPIEFGGSYGAAKFPFDLYYMDLQCTWVDTNADNYIDLPYSTGIVPDIWVSRIKCSGMGGAFSGSPSEATLVKRYFDKNHAFRAGELRLPDRGMLWADDDWKTWTPSYSVEPAYANSLRVSSAVAGMTTDGIDWSSRWRVAYETEFFMCHSSESFHQSGPDFNSAAVAAADISRLFWNCWNCSSAKYTYGQYIAGVRIFTPKYGIISVGSTKTGSMLSPTAFYTPLGQGTTHGNSFKTWFASNFSDVSWHRGMVLLGDGTLKLGRHHQPPLGANTVPVLSAITNRIVGINSTNGPIPVTVGDAETASTNLMVWAETSSRAIMPACNITLGGSNENREVTFYPVKNVSGVVTVTVTVCDGTLMTSNQFVVQVINQAPVAQTQAVSTLRNTALPITLTAVEPDGQAVSYSIVTNPAHGALGSITASNVTYTPATNYVGGDVFAFRASDGQTNSNIATVWITVTGTNALPTVSITSPTNGWTFVAPGAIVLQADASDSDGAVALVEFFSGGTKVGEDATIPYSCTWSNVPAGSYVLTARAMDNLGGSNTSAGVNIADVEAPNTPPVAVGDAYSVAEDVTLNVGVPGVLGNDTDADANSLSAVKVSDPGHGAVTLNANGSFTYTPATNYSGGDSFTYHASDGRTNSAVATVSLTVTPVNDAPMASTQAVTTVEDAAKAITLSGIDVDGDPLTYIIATGPSHGSLGVLSGASVTYTPATNYFGGDSFTFRVSDGSVMSSPAAVAITVTPVNDAPVASPQSIMTAQNTARGVTLLGADPDGDVLTYSIVTGPIHGTLGTLTGSNVTYTPALHYVGMDVFTFRVADLSGYTNQVVVTVSVASTVLAENFETAWADNARVNTTNGWVSGIEDLSIVTNPASGYSALAGGVPFPMSYDHAAGKRFLFLNTEGTAVEPPCTGAEFGDARVYIDMMVNFVVHEDIPTAALTNVDLKTAIFLKADGSVTNLYVFHGTKTAGGFGTVLASAVTNGVAPGTWCRLTVVLDAVAGAEAFRVLINGQALHSDTNAYSDNWKTVAMTPPCTPDGGTWFLSAARRAGSVGANPSRINGISFTGRGSIDDLVLTYDEPLFASGLYRISQLIGLHGSALPSGQITVPAGGSTSVVYTAAPWFRIASLSNDAVAVLAAASTSVYTNLFTAVTSDHNVQVDFAGVTAAQAGVPTNVAVDWVKQYYASEAAAAGDPDLETDYLLGLDPTNIYDIGFSFLSLSVTGGTVSSTVQLKDGIQPLHTRINGVLKLQGKADLMGEWADVGSAFISNALFDVNGKCTVQFTDASNRVYKALIAP